MGLLSSSQILDRKDVPDDVKNHIRLFSKENDDLREEKDRLLENVKNLLNFIEEQNRRKRDLRNRIITNPRTGLPNHHKLEEDLAPLFEGFTNIKEPPSIAVLIMKLDRNFDTIQKTLKPSVSEWVIYQIGRRIIENLGPSVAVYHTRDDEFIVVISGIDSKDEVSRTAKNLYYEIKQPHTFGGYHIVIGCRIGIAVFPADGFSKSAILSSADIALDTAEQNEKPILFYNENMRNDVIERMELQNSILRALEEQAIKEIDKQFEMYYQPIVVVDKLDGEIVDFKLVGCEALIRWHHPVKGMIDPARYIPIAEETGLIIPIGNWVFYTVADFFCTLKEAGIQLPVSVNLSPRQFKDDLLVENCLRSMKRKGIDCSDVTLELTEGCFIDDPLTAARKMERLAAQGITFAVDDFGTGFSSLSSLRKMPVRTIKIDKSFVRNVVENKQDQAIVRAIIALARELTFSLVVEGVETREQLGFLFAEGCRRFQGYYFARPMPGPEFREFCRRYARKSPD